MSNGGTTRIWRPSTVIATCIVTGLLFYFYSQYSSTIDVRDRGRTRHSAYDRPGTLSTFAKRLDGNITGEIVPYWAPFNTRGLPRDHGRLLEQLFVAVKSEEKEEEVDSSILELVKGKTILFFGDSNERSIVDELCIKLGTWPQIISSSNPPVKSDRWHADSHVCELEKLGGVRLISFMSYGVLIESGSRLWEKKLELNGPWAVEERIKLAKGFVEKMGFEVDLIVFNSNLWDLMYLHDTHVRLDTPYEFSLSTSTLETYISRYVFALSSLRSSFTSTRIYSRTLHPLFPGRDVDFFNLRRIAQLNQASLEILSRCEDKDLDVKLLDVGKVLEGWPTSGKEHNILRDKVHLNWNPGLWMYGEMVLEALRS